MTKEELKLIWVRAQIATLKARLADLRDKESKLLLAIGRDPINDRPRFMDLEQFQSFMSSGRFARELKETGEVMAEVPKEDLAETNTRWKPLVPSYRKILKQTFPNA